METKGLAGSGGKLIRGVGLYLAKPEWSRPCSQCAKYQYEKDGTQRLDYKGDPVLRGNGPTPCLSCPKPPTWAKGRTVKELRLLGEEREITDANREAYSAYVRFRALREFPDDPIVKWYVGLIAETEEAYERGVKENGNALLEANFKVTKAIYDLLVKKWCK